MTCCDLKRDFSKKKQTVLSDFGRLKVTSRLGLSLKLLKLRG